MSDLINMFEEAKKIGKIVYFKIDVDAKADTLIVTIRPVIMVEYIEFTGVIVEP